MSSGNATTSKSENLGTGPRRRMLLNVTIFIDEIFRE